MKNYQNYQSAVEARQRGNPIFVLRSNFSKDNKGAYRGCDDINFVNEILVQFKTISKTLVESIQKIERQVEAKDGESISLKNLQESARAMQNEFDELVNNYGRAYCYFNGPWFPSDNAEIRKYIEGKIREISAMEKLTIETITPALQILQSKLNLKIIECDAAPYRRKNNPLGFLENVAHKKDLFPGDIERFFSETLEQLNKLSEDLIVFIQKESSTMDEEKADPAICEISDRIISSMDTKSRELSVHFEKAVSYFSKIPSLSNVMSGLYALENEKTRLIEKALLDIRVKWQLKQLEACEMQTEVSLSNMEATLDIDLCRKEEEICKNAVACCQKLIGMQYKSMHYTVLSEKYRVLQKQFNTIGCNIEWCNTPEDIFYSALKGKGKNIVKIYGKDANRFFDNFIILFTDPEVRQACLLLLKNEELQTRISAHLKRMMNKKPAGFNPSLWCTSEDHYALDKHVRPLDKEMLMDFIATCRKIPKVNRELMHAPPNDPSCPPAYPEAEPIQPSRPTGCYENEKDGPLYPSPRSRH